MRQEAYFCTVEELNSLGKENIPQQLISHKFLCLLFQGCRFCVKLLGIEMDTHLDDHTAVTSRCCTPAEP